MVLDSGVCVCICDCTGGGIYTYILQTTNPNYSILESLRLRPQICTVEPGKNQGSQRQIEVAVHHPVDNHSCWRLSFFGLEDHKNSYLLVGFRVQ